MSRDWTPTELTAASAAMKASGNMGYEEFCSELEEHIKKVNYQIMPNVEQDGKYIPDYDALLAAASSEQERRYLRRVADHDMRFAYNMVYVTRMMCGHFEIFQTPQNKHYSLEENLARAREHASTSRCTRCICVGTPID